MIKLGLNFNPLRPFVNSGPNVFIKRLSSALNKNKYFEVKTGLIPNFDVGLYLIKKGKFDYNKPYFLRNGGIYFDQKNTLGGKEINKKIFSSAENSKGIIFNSEFCKKLFSSFYNLKNNVPTTVIFNAVSFEDFKFEGENYRNKLGISNNDRVIITSASWRRIKRLEETIELLNLLNSENNKYKLIVIGKLHKKFDTNPNIFFVGNVKPKFLPSWYRTGDIYLHLAWIEPNANTLHEAIASGLPTICCNNGGVGETVRACNAGIVSNTDPSYEFNLVDYYNPPKPNYQNLKKDIQEIFNNYKEFKENINTSPIDINLVSKLYFEFINKNI